jgi:hypothetical protein
MMNLLCFDFSKQEKEFYFNNIDLREFLEIFPDEQCIVINNLFAHSSIKEYNELDFSKNITIAEFKQFKKENNSTLIDTINFSTDFIRINISDEYEFLIAAGEPQFTIFVNRILKLLKIDDVVWNIIQENSGKYILVENSKIIYSFSSFDEYLQSDYSSML